VALQVLERLHVTQTEEIAQAALLCAECIEQNGVIQAYGTGHSRAFTMELAGRAGGLVPVNRIDLEDLALRAGWPLAQVKNPDIERNVEAGRAILGCYQIEPQDLFIIASHSGVNAAVVEVAQEVKERGHALVAVTSLKHTRQVTPRHASGKKLYEFADIVIDNGGPLGDALLALPGGGKACAISSLSGAMIAQMLTAETIRILLARGIAPPVFLSANVPGGIEQGEEVRRRYTGRIS
jgi:uncharacterized phosphosugar-binding protein